MFYDVAKTKEENAQRNIVTVHNANAMRYIQQGLTLTMTVAAFLLFVRKQIK